MRLFMSSTRLVAVASLVVFAPLGWAQKTMQTEAQADGLAGPIKSVSTIVRMSDVHWLQPAGPALITPVACRDCAYTPDGYRTRAGEVMDGSFIGETIELKRGEDGRVAEMLVTNAQTGQLSRRAVQGPYGKIAQTVYQDGETLVDQTFRYDGDGNLQETVTQAPDGTLMNRTVAHWSKDGGWSDETRGKDEQLESLNSFNPQNDERRSTTFDESGNVKQTWTLTNGRVTSFWESPDSASASGTTLSSFADKSDARAFHCLGDGDCDQGLVRFEYADPAKHTPMSAEWRDAAGNLLYGAYFTYTFDPSGNWTHREISVWDAKLGARTLYETDDRLISYWE